MPRYISSPDSVGFNFSLVDQSYLMDKTFHWIVIIRHDLYTPACLNTQAQLWLQRNYPCKPSVPSSLDWSRHLNTSLLMTSKRLWTTFLLQIFWTRHKLVHFSPPYISTGWSVDQNLCQLRLQFFVNVPSNPQLRILIRTSLLTLLGLEEMDSISSTSVLPLGSLLLVLELVWLRSVVMPSFQLHVLISNIAWESSFNVVFRLSWSSWVARLPFYSPITWNSSPDQAYSLHLHSCTSLPPLIGSDCTIPKSTTMPHYV